MLFLGFALAYTMFFLALEFGAFSGVAALRPPGEDGGLLQDLHGFGRAAPALPAMFAFALIGLAGLPPVLAGLFAKITVIKALLDVDSLWLALVVALISVVGLAYYVRVARDAVRPRSRAAGPAIRSVAWPVAGVLATATALALVVGFAPQLVLDLAAL